MRLAIARDRIAIPARLVLACLVLAGCARERPELDRSDEPERPGARPGVLEAADGGRRSQAGAADAGVERDAAALPADSGVAWVPIEPPAVAEQRLALARARIAWLRADELVIYPASGGEPLGREALSGARRVVPLPDGSFLAVGASASLLWRVGGKHAETLARVPLLPGAWLLPPRRVSDRLWVIAGIEPTLFEYEIGPAVGGILPIQSMIDLVAWDRRALTSLPDGSFVATGASFRRWFVGGKQAELGTPSRRGEVWRLLAVQRKDRVWIAWKDARLELCEVARGLRAVSSVEPGASFWDAASGGTRLAAVRFEQAPGAAPRFELQALSEAGALLGRVELPRSSAATRDEQARAEVANRGVAVSEDGKLAAVGGPDGFAVYELDGMKKRFEAK